MNMRRWIALLVAVGMLAAAPAVLAYNDTLPAMAVWEGGTHDGDPDEPGGLAPGSGPFGELDTGKGIHEFSLVAAVRALLPVVRLGMRAGF